MTKSKTLAVALILQALGLIALTQTWVFVAMTGERKFISLGEFDGATTYPVAMPLALFAIASILVAAISRRITQLIALVLAMLVDLVALVIVLPLVFTNSISALDSQLDRLTGIANTHGIDEVMVSTSLAPWFWAMGLLASCVWLALSLIWQKKWQQQETADRYSTSKPTKKINADTSTIEIWDNQRD